MQDASDIRELGSRITAALDRISRGLEAASGAAPDGDLAMLLDEERMANAQLNERVRTLKERQDAAMADLQGDLRRERDRVGRLDQELQGLRQANAELSETIAQLRGALAEGVGDAALVNRALLAELEGVRAAQSADRAEIEEILAELRPIVEEAS